MKVYIIVLCFILFDILTGVLKALKNEGLNSSMLREGLFHKLGEILAVVGSGLLEYSIAYIDMGVDVPVLNAVCAYICVMEFVSVIENISQMNPELAKFFKPYLEKLKDKEE